MILATVFESGISIQYYLILSTILFVIGAVGVLTRKNAIILLMCIELMLNAVNLLLVAFSSYFGKADGQIFVFFIMVVAAAEANLGRNSASYLLIYLFYSTHLRSLHIVGLSILIMAYRNARSVDVGVFNKLKG